jgi:hypothetical protein
MSGWRLAAGEPPRAFELGFTVVVWVMLYLQSMVLKLWISTQWSQHHF